MQLHQSGKLTLAALLIIGLSLTAGCGSDATSPPSTSSPPLETPPDPAPEPPAPEPPSDECEDSFEGAFEAIQTVVFERRGCTTDACHGSAASGGLDLRADVAYENLVGVASVGSSLKRVAPTKVKDSYLFQKLAAATDPGFVTIDIAGSPMPISGAPVSAKELEAIRLWIESAAPPDGAIGDEFGGNRVADLLDACLPDPDPVVIEPLPPPATEEGVQMNMPPHPIDASSELEVCFAEYVDFCEQIPEEFRTADGNSFYANGSETLADPNTHHNTLSYSGFTSETVDAAAFGRWECADGPRIGEECDPMDRDSCDGAQCRSELTPSIACIGFGPTGGGNGATPGARVKTGNGRPGYFARFPCRGYFYWNSHAFNLTPKDLLHHQYRNIYFTDDLRFESVGFQNTSRIYIAAGTPPFTKAEYCAEHVMPKGSRLIQLFSHTHKRGERFTIDLKSTGERLYDNPFWDDPISREFDPPLVLDSEDPDERTLVYCALFNNGVAADGSPDPASVTRKSFKPERTDCKPVACAEGLIGRACNGAMDHSTCDTSPGAGDGMCDACAITPGVTSDDEMFIVLGEILEIVVE